MLSVGLTEKFENNLVDYARNCSRYGTLEDRFQN